MKGFFEILLYTLLTIAAIIALPMLGAVVWGCLFVVFSWFLPDLTADLFKAMHIDKYHPFQVGMVIGFIVVILRSVFNMNATSK